MIQTTAIKLSRPEPLMVTWDIIRRCNLDCTYCESTRHDNYSKLPELEELKKTFNFVDQYADLYNSKRVDQTITNIDFTGGEPTINPDFWPLVDYIKERKKFRLSLTTNGTWGPKFTQRILDNFSHATVSWHAEDPLNKRTIENILALHTAGMSLQVNVMLHCDHFEQATLICAMLKEKGIKVNPVPIGDGNIVRKGWFIDADGTNRRTSHEYTEAQQDWFYSWMGQTSKARPEEMVKSNFVRSSILSTIFIFTAKALGELDSSTAPMQSQRVVMTIISESMRACTWASSLGALVEFAKFSEFIPAPPKGRFATPKEVTDVAAVAGGISVVVVGFSTGQVGVHPLDGFDRDGFPVG